MKASEILSQAQEKISDRKHWTRRALGRDKYGHALDEQSPKAVRWCVLGAIAEIAPVVWQTHVTMFLYKAAGEQAASHTPMWVNDELGHAAVMQMLTRARALAEAAEAAQS